MAVLSTLHLCAPPGMGYKPVAHDECPEVLLPTMSVAASNSIISSPSILHTNDVALPLGHLFGNDHFSYNLSTLLSPLDVWELHDHMTSSMDGEKVWYCSNCRDGPFGDWQNICQCCGHQRCSSCWEEKIKSK
ncbi:hypothetical protein BDW02DRAFT_565233 [Decorospora gaudefroyi]|uniref:Uncharacterized protein n=1 Tax=Decorospora gaudefroyi TaxID=184978 RepID=A0A6A5KQ83_9PLEO|nr:hypothetical protein BDW02DRAFT_565233 [Decorospora gaudefroyi]